MAKRDPYEVLGVPRDASADEIKSAYRRLARRYHPDVNREDPQAEDKFKEIGEAYSILSDADRRAKFDRTGSMEDGPEGPFFNMGGGGIGDLFEMFFGNMQQPGRPRAQGRNGEDVRVHVELTLKEVITGAHRDVAVNRSAMCTACNGLGTEGGKQPETCASCQGSGMVSRIQNTFIGSVRTSAPCPTCHGEGVLIKDPCKICRGRGAVQETARVNVNIPPGVETGQAMHMPGQGGEGIGMGRSGDLEVVLTVAGEERFERRGTALFTWARLTFAQASLGDTIDIEGVDQAYELEIPQGTQPGSQLIIKNAGLPPLHGGRRGDLIVRTTVQVPKKLNDAQEKMLKEFAELSGEPIPKGASKGLLGNIFGEEEVSWIEVKANFAEAPDDWSPIIDLFVQHGIENTLQSDFPASVIACVVEVPGAQEEMEALKAELTAAGAFEVKVGPYEEQDWEEAWKKFFKPRRIGKHFVVRPTWEEFAAEAGDYVIVLDPGQAFGTGDHATTRMCLALLESADVSGKRVLDVGCGSGVLSIGCKLLGASEVFAVDIDPLAVEVTKENAAMNDVALRAEVSDGVPEDVLDSPDVVLSNIISAALIRIAPDVAQLIRPGGRWVVSGILNANWPDVKEVAEANGFTLRDRLEEDDWVAATFLR